MSGNEIPWWKEIDPWWNLSTVFSVDAAAMLIVGADPHKLMAATSDDKRVAATSDDEGWNALRQAEIVFNALVHAINAGQLKAVKRWTAREAEWDEEPDDGEEWSNATQATDEKKREPCQRIYRTEWDKTKTTVDRNILTEWLKSRGITTGFFFPGAASHEPDYLNPDHERYAPKLAAAVRAWQAVTDPRPRTPKQAIIKWLRERAAEFGLSDEEGKLNESAIEEVAKTANWKPEGGATSTPGG